MTTIAPEVIESLETFEAIADAARMVSLDMDGGRWTLGDLANQCARKWGENTIGDLAAEIRIASKKTLYQYAKVSARFDLSTRVAFQDAPLTFSHYRAAMVAGDDAELWLAKAADDVLSVAALAREIKIATGKPVPPVKLWEGEANVHGWNETTGAILILAYADKDEIAPGRVTIKVYARAE
jgi:hypothetical protein